MEQRTDDWFDARLGKLTASRIADAIARTKTGWGASRESLLAELAHERITRQRASWFCSAAMQRGTDLEPEARSAYEALTLSTVQEVGFIEHPFIEMSGASPDGLVGSDGLVEIKCLEYKAHQALLTGASIAKRYIDQMQWQMACTQRAWCDFFAYHPGYPEHMERIVRDDKYIEDLEQLAADFLAEADDKVQRIRKVAE